jgi:hypothetical protein
MENERMDNIKGILEDIQNNKQGLVNFEGGNFNKNQGSGSVEVEETEDENGMQRKVIRDLGNGKKSIEITRVMKNHHNKGINILILILIFILNINLNNLFFSVFFIFFYIFYFIKYIYYYIYYH